jgi:Uri superfamily endonuclease
MHHSVFTARSLDLVACTYHTYQLQIHVAQPLRLNIGALGEHVFPAGNYVYTGSAKRNFEARIARHLRYDKKIRWHIDYLLTAPGVTVTHVIRSDENECQLNQATPGTIPIRGFGASDCRAGCHSHLKYLGDNPRPVQSPKQS